MLNQQDQEVLNKILHGYGLDHEWAVLRKIIQICSLDFDEFIENESLLTAQLLESHYEDILKCVSDENITYQDHLVYMVLGVLIIKTKARLPKKLCDKIINSANWEFELKTRWRIVDEDFLKKRRETLLEFKEMIRNHKEGRILNVDLHEISANFEYDCLGQRFAEKFLRACDIDSLEDITRKALETNLDKVLFLIEKEPPFDPYSDYLTLGSLILKTGATIPEDLRGKIIEIADWEEELKKRWTLADEDLLSSRKRILITFQNTIRNYCQK